MLNEVLRISCFHGMVPREGAEKVLVNDGAFLLRKTEYQNKERFVLSVNYHGYVHHIIIDHSAGKWRFTEVNKIPILFIFSTHSKRNYRK